MKFRSLFGISVMLFSPTVLAGEATSQPIDVSLAGMSRANLDSFESIRYSSSTLALLSRYQIGVGADLNTGLEWQAEAAALDSNTGPVSLGLLFQYSSGDEVVQEEALPGWRLPEDDLIEDQTDVLFGAGTAISFNNRQYAVGVGAFYIGKTINGEERIYNKSAFELWQDRNDLGTESVYSSHQLELNTSVAGKFREQIVATVGANDLLAASGARYFFGACRFGPVDLPISGPYSSFGGVEIDVETQMTSAGFGMHYVGLSGDIPIASKVRLRSGYRYDFPLDEHVPALGMGIDDGNYSLDYGVQVRISSQVVQQHAIGIRVRL